MRKQKLMYDQLTDLIELSRIDDFKTVIVMPQIIEAKKLIKKNPKTTSELFQILCAMNLLNAALKNKEFKDEVYYGMLKPQVSRLLSFILEQGVIKFDIQFYINQQEQCAYIEIKTLQFSFHNITINEKLQNFINSAENKVRKWKGVRLQKIAGELFNYAVDENRFV